MRAFIVSTLVNSVIFLVLSRVIAGLDFKGLSAIVISGAVFSLVNEWMRPVLTALSLPLLLITSGAFILVINMILIGLTAWLVPGFSIASIRALLLSGIVIWAINFFFAQFKQRSRRFKA